MTVQFSSPGGACALTATRTTAGTELDVPAIANRSVAPRMTSVDQWRGTTVTAAAVAAGAEGQNLDEMGRKRPTCSLNSQKSVEARGRREA